MWQQIRPHALTIRLKVHSNKRYFFIRTNIDLFICLTGRDTRWSDYNNRWCCYGGGVGGFAGASWCVSYFRNAGEEMYWSGHLDLIRTSGLRGARQSLSTPLATVVQKIHLPPSPIPFFFFSILFGSFLLEVKRKSHLHQAKLWWAALSVQKTWGFDSFNSIVINYFSTVVGPSLPSPTACCYSGGGGGWRQHMISAALITGLTGKRPGQHWANTSQSHPLCRMGLEKLASYMPFVYSLVCNRKIQCCQLCRRCWVTYLLCSSILLSIFPPLIHSLPPGL